MGFSKYNKDRPFLVITQHLVPSAGENTSIKNWGKTGHKDRQEMVSIVDSITNKHLTTAAVIIDILRRKIVKSRYPEADEEVLKHFLTKYKSQIAEGIDIWMKGQYDDKESAEQFVEKLGIDIDEEIEKLDQIKIDVGNDTEK